MAAAGFDFKVDTSNYLGQDYKVFKEYVYGLALSQPSKYFDLRQKVIKDCKTAIVKDMYVIIYNMLNEGKNKGNNVIDGEFATHPPSYPKQLINEFALGASKTLDKIFDEAVEIILPLDYKKIAEKSLEVKGSGSKIDA